MLVIHDAVWPPVTGKMTGRLKFSLNYVMSIKSEPTKEKYYAH